MKRYPEYKDSGVEWLGEVPKHWNIKKIKHTTYVKGRIGWKGLKSDEYKIKSDAFLVTGTDFIEGRINWNSCVQIEKERYEEDPFIQLQENDLLITKDGTIGKIALVKNLYGIATLNSGVFVTRPISHYQTDFMYWLLFSNVFWSFIDFNKKGTTINHLYQETFNEFKFVAPPLNEQLAISKYLNNKIAEIDSLIANKKQMIDLLKEERAAIINHAVTKGINPDAEMKDSGVEWLGEVPKHWIVKRLKHISPKQSVGLVINPSTYVNEKGTIPFFFGGDIREGKITTNNVRRITEEGNKQIPQSILHTGDLVTVRVGYPGITAVIPPELDGSNCASMMIIKGIQTFNSYWLCYTMNSMIGKWQVEIVQYGAAQKQFNIAHAVEFRFPFPPLAEQIKIVNYLNNKTSKIDSSITHIEKEISLIEEYRTALINETVTGKIDIRDKVNV